MKMWRQFDQMRGDHCRTWHRRSDVLDALRAIGSPFTWHDCQKAMAALPKPEMRYGHYRYTDLHLAVVLMAAGREMA
jgi:hypothetical protein